MFVDARTFDHGTHLRADVCIVGAGPAGITLARDLARNGRRVVLVETGGLEPERAYERLNEGSSDGMPERRLTRCRARVLGGATSKWAGWCRPLDPEDFEARPWLPRSGWPIRRTDLEPYYMRAQRTCQAGALEYDSETIADRVGLPTIPFDGARASTVVYQYSPPTRFGEEYRADLEGAPDIEVVLHGSLVHMVLSDDGFAVTGFRCSDLGGKEFAITADRYVLAAGGIENARLLLASNEQEPSGIGNRHGHVGRYFMEHPHFYAWAYLLTPDPASLDLYLGRHRVLTFDPKETRGRDTTVAAALSLPAELRASEGLQGLAVTLREEQLDRAFEGPLDPSDISAIFESSGGSVGDSRLYRLDIRCEQQPNHSSYVGLGDDRDSLGLPRVHVSWSLAPGDLESVRRTLEIFAAELGRLGLGRIWLPENNGTYAPPTIGAGCHHLGTTRMSETPADGVVDADCKVHGIANLFVLGSSVFPTGGFANPTLTIVDLSHRLADHLAGPA